MKIHSTRSREALTYFHKNMDIVFRRGTPIESIKEAATICLHLADLDYFINAALPTLVQPINLVIVGSDQTFPNYTDNRKGTSWDNMATMIRPKNLNILFQHSYINKIFVENLDCACPKTLPVPLGLNANHSPTKLAYFLENENIDADKPLKFTNFNVSRFNSIQWAERHYVNKLCEKHWSEHYIETHTQDKLKPLTHESYLKSLSEYMFTVCVHGGGLDVNPKLWEALLVGTIPIIRKNKPYTDIYTDLDFPVVMIEDWTDNTITLEKLTSWRDRYYHHFTDPDKRQDMLYKLSVDYWIDYVTFSENDKR